MIQKPTFRSTWLPLILAGFALLALNLGLYLRLSADPLANVEFIELPYTETFDTLNDISELPYESFGGDWEIRDSSLVQISTTGNDLGTLIPINAPEDLAYQFGVDMRYLSGTMGGGLIFNAQQIASRQKSHMIRFNVDNNELYLIFGYFDDESNFFGQGSVKLGIAPTSQDVHRVGVIVQNNTYAITVDQQEIITNIPQQYHGGFAGLITSNSQVVFDNVSVTAIDSVPAITPEATPIVETVGTVPTANPTTDFEGNGALMFSDSFDVASGGDSPWIPFSGNWVFDNGALVQQQFDGYDLGIGHQSQFGDMLLRVNFEHREGQGAGILFNMPQPDTKNGAEMVRYVPDADFIVWGNFDENGAFNAGGSAPVPDPSTASHVLEIITADGRFTVRLDGQIVAENISIQSGSGHIGLTSAQSVVAFTAVEVFSTNAQPIEEVTPDPTPSPETDLTLSTINGEWITEDGVIKQIDQSPIDFVAGTGVAAERFTISADILLPTDEAVVDAGGGIVFHMQQRDNPAGGQMVRFGNGGSEVFWGQYDNDGTFVGQGGAPLELDTIQSHNLKLIVRESEYDILVDDIIIVNSVPLQQSNGWIGLISFRGPVTYSNIQLSISGT